MDAPAPTQARLKRTARVSRGRRVLLALGLCAALVALLSARQATAQDATEVPASTPESAQAADASAQAATAALVQPATLQVHGFRGDVSLRRLLLRGALAEDAVLLAQDLPDGDGDDVLPAGALALQAGAGEDSAAEQGGVRPVDLQVSLGNAASGRYSGEALLMGGGIEAPVALEVAVKDRPWWPLATLLAGVVVGMAITWYRQQLGPRDRLLVAVDDLLREADRDELLRADARGADFRRRIDLHAADAGAAIRSRAYDGAQRNLALGRRTLDLWRRERPGWLQALDRRDALAAALGDAWTPGDAPSPFVRDLEAALAGALPALLEQATTGALATDAGALAPRYDGALRTINEWSGRYAAFGRGLDQARDLMAVAPPTQAAALRTALVDMEGVFAALQPVSAAGDPPRAATLEADLRKALAAAQALANAETRELAGPPRPAMEQAPLPPAPSWRPLDAEIAAPERVARARARTWVAWVLGFVVAAGLLGGAGFQELYVDNPVFGARRWFDYFTLLAWGLGAEATSASIAGLLRSWDLPVIGRAGKAEGGS